MFLVAAPCNLLQWPRDWTLVRLATTVKTLQSLQLKILQPSPLAVFINYRQMLQSNHLGYICQVRNSAVIFLVVKSSWLHGQAVVCCNVWVKSKGGRLQNNIQEEATRPRWFGKSSTDIKYHLSGEILKGKVYLRFLEPFKYLNL